MVNLVNTILDDKEAIIFLGSGASTEGRQGDKSFPSFEELKDSILKDWGFDPKNKKKREENFQTVRKRWKNEKNLASRLSKYLDGDPGSAHNKLAALSLSLPSEYKMLFYLTTNYDDLMRKAFTALESNPIKKFTIRLISLPRKVIDSRYQEIVSNIDAHITKGSPVIVKLFGDLDSESPIFPEDDMPEGFDKFVIEQMETWLKKPMIFIGYSFKDKIMKSFLSSHNRGNSIFIVNPCKDLAKYEREHKGVYHIQKTFSEFIKELIELIEKRGIPVKQKIVELLKYSAPSVKYIDFDSLKSRIIECSEVSLMRAEDKLPKIEIDGKTKEFIPIDRPDTGPDFKRFIKSDKPLFALIGDSGSGKSTLLYEVAKNPINEGFITLFYDVHHLQEPGSLRKRLALDFNCNVEQLEIFFEHIEKIFSNENKRLLIIVDGLNESVKIVPSEIKSGIDDLGNKLPKSIKIAYSCRTIFWNSYVKVESPILTNLYHDSKEFLLHFYSLVEVQAAFNLYHQLYEFEGTFDSLKDEFKDKIRDPLMLRMLAEGYQGERLPTFAPAVKIFKKYEETLRKRFQGSFLMDFMEELVIDKFNEIETNQSVSDQFEVRRIRSNHILSDITLQQLIYNNKKPLVLLEDEGILNSIDKDKFIYRFTYDRFFEYLLGKEIGIQLNVISHEDFVSKLSEKILAFQRIHFSFLQALKSEIIRCNIDDQKGNWTFYDPKILQEFLNNPDAAIKNFTKEVLRELTFEAEKDTFAALKQITDDELEWKLLALDIAGDSPKIKPILLEGIFSNVKHFTRRCIEILSVINKDDTIRREFEDLIIDKIATVESFNEEHANGLIYYTAIIFALEEHTKNDPFIEVKKFLRIILEPYKEKLYEIKDVIVKKLVILLKEEGYRFFTSNSDGVGIEYIWKVFSKNERDAAKKLIPLIIDPNIYLVEDSIETITFFASELKYWQKKNDFSNNEFYTYGIEYRIAMWILVLRSIKKYIEVKDILNNFVKVENWNAIDFSLSTMRRILQFIHFDNESIIKDGFETMKEWVDKFENNVEMFYQTLKEEDPFSCTFNPIDPTASIDSKFFSSQEGPIKFLEDILLSPNLSKVQLALLSTRFFWRDNPQKILGTLEIVINNNVPIIKDWLERILKEIYLVYPRLVENFFHRNRLNLERIQAIKFRNDINDPTGARYDGEPLYKAIFLKNRKRRTVFAQWYLKLLESKNLDSFCFDFVDYIFKSIFK